MSKFRALLLLSTLIPLAACGPHRRGLAGRGHARAAARAGAGAAAAAAAPGGGTPAAGCPAGTVDRGVIATAFRNCELSGRISDDYTVQRLPGVIYSLSGPGQCRHRRRRRRHRWPAAIRCTLTIQAGVTIFGSSGNDYLVVNRGSRLNAVGTPTLPIIFTAARQCRRHRTPIQPGPVGRHHPARPRPDQRLQHRRSGRLGQLPAGDRGHHRLALRRRHRHRQQRHPAISSRSAIRASRSRRATSFRA